MVKTTIISCMKNEGPFILEWIAYNRIIGVTDFLIYTNDCSDGTDDLLDVLDQHGIVTHLPNPAKPGQRYQMQALKHAARQPLVSDADWVFVCDVDEFLNIHIGDQTLSDLIEACGNPNAISLTMRMMANDGVEKFEDRPIIEQFTKSHDPVFWAGQKAIEVKSLTRADFPLKFFGVHRPFVKNGIDLSSTKISWADGSGRQVSEAFIEGKQKRRKHRLPAAGSSDFATLNHYTLRSLDSYIVKSHRGDANRPNRHFHLDYWMGRNVASWTDTRILSRLPALEQEITFLKHLDGVAEAHDEAVERHKALIFQLQFEPEYAALREDILNSSDQGLLPERVLGS